MRGANRVLAHHKALSTMSFAQSYFADVEKVLLALSGVAGHAGHNVIKGSAREYFVNDFLAKNISPLWTVGSGEIIHRETKAPDKRNQIDAVVYNSQMPRFEYEPGVAAFLAEGVSAFIEVKTTLTKEHLKKAIETATRIKSYPREVTQRFNPHGMVKAPRIYSFVLAFDGCTAQTLPRWLVEAHEELGISLHGLAATPPKERANYDNRSIDGVFVLGKGYALLDSTPFHYAIKEKEANRDFVWIWGRDNALMMLWIYLNEVNKVLAWNQFRLTDYLPTIAGFLSDGKD